MYLQAGRRCDRRLWRRIARAPEAAAGRPGEPPLVWATRRLGPGASRRGVGGDTARQGQAAAGAAPCMLEGSSTWRNSGSGSGVNSSRMSKLHLRAPRRGVGVGSAAWAGPHGRAAACHWAPSARAARAECVAQPSSREPQPRDAVAAGCGTTKTTRGASRRTVQGRGSRPGRPPAPPARCRSAARARPSAPPWARPPSPSTRSGSGSPASAWGGSLGCSAP